MKAIFHLHTAYSHDASLPIKYLLDQLHRKNIGTLAITEHNHMDSFESAKQYIQEKNYNIKLIPGEEIATKEGEVIGLFLKKPIDKGLSLLETIKEIKNQGGVVYIPHPFDEVRSERIRNKEDIISILLDIDIVEIYNARSFQGNETAYQFAKEHNLLMLGGPDAHFKSELWNCIVELPDFEMNRDSFLESVSQAQIIQKKRSYTGVIKSGLIKRLRKIGLLRYARK